MIDPRLQRLADICQTPITDPNPKLVLVDPDVWEFQPGTCPTLFSSIENHPEHAWYMPELEGAKDPDDALDCILSALVWSLKSNPAVPGNNH